MKILNYLTIPILTFILFSCSDRKGAKIERDTIHDSIYIKDFDQYWNAINDNFAYFDTRKTNWEKVKTIYQPMVDTVNTRNEFIAILEKCNNELYNGHIGLNTNIASSSKLIPTSSDLSIKYKDKRFFIEAIRENAVIDTGNLKVGMEILKYNDVAIDSAIKEFLPKSFNNYNDEVFEFAANTLLAGKHNSERMISVKSKDQILNIKLPYSTNDNFYPYNEVLTSRIMDNNIGYIRINNSLGNNELISKFDKALDELMTTKALILDLRETPSGGNNTIAKAIMGRFMEEEKPYQRYSYVFDEKETGIKQIWHELVIPRKEIYTKPLILLVGKWTGSMGEGITIGFDGMERAEIVGTGMARLLGAIWNNKLVESGIVFQYPGIKIFHIDKTPREDFVPENIVTANTDYIEIAKVIINRNTSTSSAE